MNNVTLRENDVGFAVSKKWHDRWVSSIDYDSKFQPGEVEWLPKEFAEILTLRELETSYCIVHSILWNDIKWKYGLIKHPTKSSAFVIPASYGENGLNFSFSYLKLSFMMVISSIGRVSNTRKRVHVQMPITDENALENIVKLIFKIKKEMVLEYSFDECFEQDVFAKLEELSKRDMVIHVVIIDPSIPKGALGLVNCGATCYMNSALQCMFSIPHLKKYFLSYKKSDSESDSVSSLFGSLIRYIWRDKRRPSYTPQFLKFMMGKRFPIYATFQQQDITQFLLNLLDAINQELSQVDEKEIQNAEQKEEENNLTEKEKAEAAWMLHRSRNNSIISDTFYGQFCSTLTCVECDRVISTNYEPFPFLSVALTTEKQYYVIECFYMKMESCSPIYIVNAEIPKKSTIRDLRKVILEDMRYDEQNIPINKQFDLNFAEVDENNETLTICNDNCILPTSKKLVVYETRKCDGPCSLLKVIVEGQLPFLIPFKIEEFCDPYSEVFAHLLQRYDCDCDQIEFFQTDDSDTFRVIKLNIDCRQEIEKYDIFSKDRLKTFKDQNQPIDLKTCFELFTSEEKMSNDCKIDCEACKKEVNVKKQFSIHRFPEVMIVQLKRYTFFDMNNTKITTPIICPKEDFQPMPNAPSYNLTAFAVHYGGLGGGHYTAVSRNLESNKWYSFDDSHVAELKEVDPKDAIVLVFEKKTADTEINSPSTECQRLPFTSDINSEIDSIAESMGLMSLNPDLVNSNQKAAEEIGSKTGSAEANSPDQNSYAHSMQKQRTEEHEEEKVTLFSLKREHENLRTNTITDFGYKTRTFTNTAMKK